MDFSDFFRVATIFEDHFPAFFLKNGGFSSYFCMKKVYFSSFDIKKDI